MQHCKDCANSVFDAVWGEFKCKIKHRTCCPYTHDKNCDKYEQRKETTKKGS